LRGNLDATAALPGLLRVLSSPPRRNFVRDMAGNGLAQ
jgi:hypothetical protein